MNKWESKIRFKEKEVHPDNKIGYNNEDLMLSDFMVWLTNTHKINPLYLKPNATNPKDKKPVNELMSIFHIENEGTFGGDYGSMQGAISKGKGKKKGILDNMSCYLGILNFLEFKLDGGVFSDEQLYFISLLVKWNVPVFIIRDFEMFRFAIEEVILKGIKLKGLVYTNTNQIKTQIK